METLAKADAFFFITAAAVIIIGILVVVIAAYTIRILRDFKYISTRLKEETDATAEDIRELRRDLRSRGWSMGIFGSLAHFFRKRRKGRSKHSRENTHHG